MSRRKGTPPVDASLDELDRQIAELKALREVKLAQAGQPHKTDAPTLQPEAPPPRASRRRANPTKPALHTGGGAVFKQQVTTAEGHVIGRDFVQLIEHMTVQGEDAQHATLALASYLHVLRA